MSVQVLLALVNTELFESMTIEERDSATTALMREIEQDPELKARLFAVIKPSVDLVMATKTISTEV